MFEPTWFGPAWFAPAWFPPGVATIPVWEGVLTPRQARFYTHRFSVWRATEVIQAGTGKPRRSVWLLVMTAIPCMFQTGKSQQGSGPAIIIDEDDNLFTLDALRMPPGVDIRVGDTILQTAGPEPGGWWTARGEPQVRLRVPYQEVLCSRTPKAPAGITV